MTATQAISGGFARALEFSGRSRRPEYWFFFAFVFAGAALLGAADLALGRPTAGWLVTAFQIVVFLPFLAVGWRRLQDTGRPGWFLLVPVAIVVGSTIVSGSVMQQMAALIVPALRDGSGAPGGLLGALSLLQIAAGAVIVWWMSRPSQRGPNSYGPEPRVR